MKKAGLCVPAVTLLAMFLLVMAAFPAHAAEKTKYVFKMGTLAPKGIGWAKAWEEVLAPALAKATNNELSFKTYYGGVMGDDEDYIKKMKIGQLQSASITAQGAILACPEISVLTLPFLLENYDEVDYIRPKLFPVFDSYAQRQGFKILYWFEQDFDQLYSSKVPFTKLEDFASGKFLTWYGPVEQKCLEALGANPIPINGPEVPAALRQKIVDSLIAPAVWVVGTQTYTILKYVNTMKIRYAPGFHIWSMKAYNELSPDYQKRCVATRDSALPEFIKRTRAANVQALRAITVHGGVKQVNPTPEALALIKKRARPVWDSLAGHSYPKEVLAQVTAMLEEYRATKAKR